MQTNTTVLREISFQLTEGNPWWGMLLANEYILQSNPLRTAFILRFKRSIGSAPTGRGSLADVLIRGKRRSDLSASQLSAVGARTVRAVRTNSGIKSSRRVLARAVGVAQRPTASHRLAVRQRNSHVARFSAYASRGNESDRELSSSPPLPIYGN
jgi:hypothetical protein